LRSKIGGGHAELEGVIDTFPDPVIAENQRAATLHHRVRNPHRLPLAKRRSGPNDPIPASARSLIALHPTEALARALATSRSDEPAPAARGCPDRIDSPYSSGHPVEEVPRLPAEPLDVRVDPSRPSRRLTDALWRHSTAGAAAVSRCIQRVPQPLPRSNYRRPRLGLRFAHRGSRHELGTPGRSLTSNTQ